VLAAGLPACGYEDTGFPYEQPFPEVLDAQAPPAPAGLAVLDVEGTDFTFWPYTGSDFSGTPVDPVNLVFTGEADPVRIRAALLGLDGNRPGLPPGYPFDAVWTEAIGDVQTGYSEFAGWSGSVIQLQLGAYDPLRVHLRLFPAGALPGGGSVTLGGAHFEVLIPNTTEHQVLSWELAEQIVVYDLARAGILTAPPAPTGPINAAPSYREIPAVIYNLLPPELVAVTGGPAQPTAAPVPLASDGSATRLALGPGAGAHPPDMVQTLTVVLDQVVPKPFCSDGPFDWVLVSGAVDFVREGTVTALGQYSYHARYEGRVMVTPVDITTDPPVPSGEPFEARVSGDQDGFSQGDRWRVQARDTRLAPPGEGTEFLNSLLRVSSQGGNESRVHSRCLEP